MQELDAVRHYSRLPERIAWKNYLKKKLIDNYILSDHSSYTKIKQHDKNIIESIWKQPISPSTKIKLFLHKSAVVGVSISKVNKFKRNFKQSKQNLMIIWSNCNLCVNLIGICLFFNENMETISVAACKMKCLYERCLVKSDNVVITQYFKFSMNK